MLTDVCFVCSEFHIRWKALACSVLSSVSLVLSIPLNSRSRSRTPFANMSDRSLHPSTCWSFQICQKQDQARLCVAFCARLLCVIQQLAMCQHCSTHILCQESSRRPISIWHHWINQPNQNYNANSHLFNQPLFSKIFHHSNSFDRTYRHLNCCIFIVFFTCSVCLIFQSLLLSPQWSSVWYRCRHRFYHS